MCSLQENEDELFKAQQEDPNIQLLIQLKNGSGDSRREAELNPKVFASVRPIAGPKSAVGENTSSKF